MKLYAAMGRLFRRSYTAKLFAVAFLGTHVPLLVLLGWSLSIGLDSDASLMQVMVIALLATVAGFALTLYLLHQLLAPIRAVAEALDGYERARELPALPEDNEDEVGRLMRGVNHNLHRLDEGIRTLESVAQHDALTGLLNRRGAQARFELRAQESDAGIPFCLVLLDMDGLKEVNDRLGHAEGDRLLVTAANGLRACLSGADWISRWGGDEFVLAMQGEQEQVQARIVDCLQVLVSGQQPVRFSAGVAQWCSGDTFIDVYRRADEAMYANKARQKTRSMEGEIG